MPTDFVPEGNPAHGKITSGLETNASVERTIEFVLTQLPKWRDDPSRPFEESEERLNAQLCKYLQVAARHSLKMVFFHHEEKQTATRRVDFSASPIKSQIIGATLYTIYDPFLVLEGKRLPQPRNDLKREKEYVTGRETRSGGIQRFKLGLHGAKHEIAAIVGYIQSDSPTNWVTRINGWVRELERSIQTDGTKWSSTDRLSEFSENKTQRIATSRSTHVRCCGTTPEISIHHLWVQL